MSTPAIIRIGNPDKPETIQEFDIASGELDVKKLLGALDRKNTGTVLDYQALAASVTKLAKNFHRFAHIDLPSDSSIEKELTLLVEHLKNNANKLGDNAPKHFKQMLNTFGAEEITEMAETSASIWGALSSFSKGATTLPIAPFRILHAAVLGGAEGQEILTRNLTKISDADAEKIGAIYATARYQIEQCGQANDTGLDWFMNRVSAAITYVGALFTSSGIPAMFSGAFEFVCSFDWETKTFTKDWDACIQKSKTETQSYVDVAPKSFNEALAMAMRNHKVTDAHKKALDLVSTVNPEFAALLKENAVFVNNEGQYHVYTFENGQVTTKPLKLGDKILTTGDAVSDAVVALRDIWPADVYETIGAVAVGAPQLYKGYRGMKDGLLLGGKAYEYADDAGKVIKVSGRDVLNQIKEYNGLQKQIDAAEEGVSQLKVGVKSKNWNPLNWAKSRDEVVKLGQEEIYALADKQRNVLEELEKAKGLGEGKFARLEKIATRGEHGLPRKIFWEPWQNFNAMATEQMINFGNSIKNKASSFVTWAKEGVNTIGNAIFDTKAMQFKGNNLVSLGANGLMDGGEWIAKTGENVLASSPTLSNATKFIGKNSGTILAGADVVVEGAQVAMVMKDHGFESKETVNATAAWATRLSGGVLGGAAAGFGLGMFGIVSGPGAIITIPACTIAGAIGGEVFVQKTNNWLGRFANNVVTPWMDNLFGGSESAVDPKSTSRVEPNANLIPDVDMSKALLEQEEKTKTAQLNARNAVSFRNVTSTQLGGVGSNPVNTDFNNLTVPANFGATNIQIGANLLNPAS